ncbi:superoxide dismutase family protein [Rhodohalobacter mucosus]|nr:superoxide dismutase family protein [Rhodohalobacter mucosus]
MSLKAYFSTLTLLIAVLLVAGCTQTQQQSENMEEEPETMIEKAVAVIYPTEGNDIEGMVTFTQTEDGVRVQATVSGLVEQSLHGFHIHQYGDCRASDGTSAAGHFNPMDMPHGSPTDDDRHVGDLGNLPTNEEGVAEIDYTDDVVELNGPNSILGRGVIVHAGQDDLETQPTGAAGARLGCGVIGVANPDY